MVKYVRTQLGQEGAWQSVSGTDRKSSREGDSNLGQGNLQGIKSSLQME